MQKVYFKAGTNIHSHKYDVMDEDGVTLHESISIKDLLVRKPVSDIDL